MGQPPGRNEGFGARSVSVFSFSLHPSFCMQNVSCVVMCSHVCQFLPLSNFLFSDGYLAKMISEYESQIYDMKRKHDEELSLKAAQQYVYSTRLSLYRSVHLALF